MKALLALPNFKAYCALVIIYIVWGTTLGAIHIGVETIPPMLLVCLRYTIAGALMIALCRVKGEALPKGQDLKIHLLIGFLVFFVGNTFIYWALQYIPTGMGAALTSTCPFWMLWLAAILPPREKIPPAAIAGVSIGFGGMLILLTPRLMEPLQITGYFWVSVVGVLLMSIFWSLGSIIARKHHTADSLLMGVGVQNLFAGLLLIPVCLVIPGATQFTPSLSSLLALAYLILIGTMLAFPCYVYILQTLSMPMITTISYVSPLLTVLFGWLFLSEPVTLTSALGTVVILVGVAIVQWVNQAKKLHQDKAAQGKESAVPLSEVPIETV